MLNPNHTLLQLSPTLSGERCFIELSMLNKGATINFGALTIRELRELREDLVKATETLDSAIKKQEYRFGNGSN